MPLFFSPRGRTALERGLRAGGVFVVLAAVILLYRCHFERKIERLEAEQTLRDQARVLSAEDRRYLSEAARDLKNRYGLTFRARIGRGPAATPALDEKTVYIDLDLDTKAASVILPPLLARALDPRLPEYLRQDHFGPYLDDGAPGEGLCAAVALVLHELEDMAKEGEGGRNRNEE